MNRLQQEHPPHQSRWAGDPVNWYPWGQEAFARARQEHKPMLISIAFVCGLRLIWVYVFFPLAPSLGMLYLSYPISWSMMLVAQTICYLVTRKKIFRELESTIA